MPTTQTKHVLDTSPIDLATAFIYLVAEIPVKLKAAIVNNPRILDTKRIEPFPN